MTRAAMARDGFRKRAVASGLIALLAAVAGSCVIPDQNRPDGPSYGTVWHKDADGGVAVYRYLCESNQVHPIDGFGVRVGRTDRSEPASIRGEYDWSGDVGRVYVLELERNGVSRDDAERIRNAWKGNAIIQLDVGNEPGTELTRADAGSLPVDQWVGGATNEYLDRPYKSYDEWLSFAEKC